MKKTLFAAIIILCSITTYAQIDSSKYTLSSSKQIVDENHPIVTNLLLSHQNKSQYVSIECSDSLYLYFNTIDKILYRLPFKKIIIENGIGYSEIGYSENSKSSLNTALTKFSNAAQTALILPILGGLLAIPLGFPNGYYAIGGATAISYILNMSSYAHLKRFARYNTAIDFNQW
jgi:hypothetical protein